MRERVQRTLARRLGADPHRQPAARPADPLPDLPPRGPGFLGVLGPEDQPARMTFFAAIAGKRPPREEAILIGKDIGLGPVLGAHLGRHLPAHRPGRARPARRHPPSATRCAATSLASAPAGRTGTLGRHRPRRELSRLRRRRVHHRPAHRRRRRPQSRHLTASPVHLTPIVTRGTSIRPREIRRSGGRSQPAGMPSEPHPNGRSVAPVCARHSPRPARRAPQRRMHMMASARRYESRSRRK